MSVDLQPADQAQLISPEDLLAGSAAVHDIDVPSAVLMPGGDSDAAPHGGVIRMRPLTVATLTLVSRAAREDPALIPLFMIKEAVVEPAMTLDQIRRMHVGLVYFLVGHVNRISGLDASGGPVEQVAETPIGRSHVLLAKHFGWTPEQVGRLTPGQVAAYLAGIKSYLQGEAAP